MRLPRLTVPGFVVGLFLAAGSAMAGAIPQGAASVASVRSGWIERVTDMAAKNGRIATMKADSTLTWAAYLMDELDEDPRGCGGPGAFSGFRQSLWLVNIETGEETLVEQGFTYDTGVGNFCATNMRTAFAISDGGQKVAWLSQPNLATNPELKVYDRVGGDTTTVLAQVPYDSFGSVNPRHIEPQALADLFTISGDGSTVYFVNRFGPLGTITDQEPPPPPSGFSVYRVATDGSGAEAVVTQGIMASIPGIDANAVSVIAAGGRLATNQAGSFVLVPVGGFDASANPFRNLLKVPPGGDPSGIEVLLSRPAGEDVGWSGPSLTADGSQMCYLWNPVGTFPDDEGVFIQPPTAGAARTIMDGGIIFGPSSSTLPYAPTINASGSHTAQWISRAGTTAVRLARTDGTGRELVSWPAASPADRAFAYVDEFGDDVVFPGRILDGVVPGDGILREDILRVRFGSMVPVVAPDGLPAISGLRVSPTVAVVREIGLSLLQPLACYFSGTGVALGCAYTAGTDDVFHEIRGGGGSLGFRPDLGGILDDGAWEGVDQAAGDGIYSEGFVGVFANSNTPGDFLNVRFAMTTTTGLASFEDYVLPLYKGGEARVFRDISTVGAGEPAEDYDFDAGNVTMSVVGSDDFFRIHVEPVLDAPDGLTRAVGQFWRIFAEGLNDGAHFEIFVTLEYDETLVPPGSSESGLALFRSETGAAPWELVPAVVDPVANTIMTLDPVTKFSFWALATGSYEGFAIQ